MLIGLTSRTGKSLAINCDLSTTFGDIVKVCHGWFENEWCHLDELEEFMDRLWLYFNP